MKAILRNYGIRMTTEQRQVARAQAGDMVRTRGTARVPRPPRDVILQAGPRGVLLSWTLPDDGGQDVRGWRVYKGDESTLYCEIKDRGTRQHFVEATAGTTPPQNNLFVSAFNALGVESAKVQVQGAATSETGAPTMPSSPPDYGNTGGRVNPYNARFANPN
jgi:hypothetical protein